MRLLNAVCFAFAMFSRLPVPRVEWNEKNMRYAMAAFPLVGVAVGAVVLGWGCLASWLALGRFLRGTGFALLPLAVAGCIHMDGFCDVVDALASNGDREKKRAILKDPHIGSFAAIAAAGHLLLFAALAGETLGDVRGLLSLALIFVLSRALCGIAVACFPCSADGGLGMTFRDAAAKRTSVAVLTAVAIVVGALLVLWGGVAGAAALGCSAFAFAAYYRVAMRGFGGNSGDIAGWFIQVCELAALAGLALTQKAVAVW